MAAAIRMEKAALWWPAQAHCHIQRPDRQILLQPVADSPAHDAAAMQIEDDGEIEPAFCSADIGDVPRPFTIRGIGGKIPVSQFAATPRRWWLSVVTLCLRVRTGLIPLIRMRRPTRRSPTSSPASFNSIVILGRP